MKQLWIKQESLVFFMVNYPYLQQNLYTLKLENSPAGWDFHISVRISSTLQCFSKWSASLSYWWNRPSLPCFGGLSLSPLARLIRLRKSPLKWAWKTVGDQMIKWTFPGCEDTEITHWKRLLFKPDLIASKNLRVGNLLIFRRSWNSRGHVR